MSIATVTSRGRVTIPKRVRCEMGLAPGDRVYFVRMDGGHYELVPVSCSIRALKGIVPRLDTQVSLGDMQAAIQSEAVNE